jgi:hypothetical protein
MTKAPEITEIRARVADWRLPQCARSVPPESQAQRQGTPRSEVPSLPGREGRIPEVIILCRDAASEQTGLSLMEALWMLAHLAGVRGLASRQAESPSGPGSHRRVRDRTVRRSTPRLRRTRSPKGTRRSKVTTR